MKKILILCMAIVLAFFSFPVAYASGDFTAEAKINYYDDTVTVSGNIGRGNERILIVDENPSGSEKIQHQRSFLSESDGGFTYTYKVNSSFSGVSGIHKVYLTTIGNTNAECTYYYEKSESDLLKNKIKLFIEADKTTLATYLADVEYCVLFGASGNELYTKMDKEELAGKCVVALNALNIDENIQLTVDKVNEILLTYSLLCTYKNSKSELLYKDGELLYKDIIKAEEIDSTYNVTAYSIYENIISDSGKQKITDYLLGKDYTDLADFHKKFIEKTILISLTNAKQNGYGHIKTILAPQNLNYLGIIFNRTLSDANAMTIASKTAGYASVSELQLALNSLPTDTIISGGSPTVGGFSGSSSVGGGYTVDKNIEEIVPNKPQPQETFSDMGNANWAKEAVYALYNKGIVSGTGENKFSPSSSLLREQIAKILCLAMELSPAQGASHFSDVNPNEWYAPYVNALFEKGVIKGKTEEKFGVGEEVTREELCTMIYRAMPEIFKGEYSEVSFSDNVNIADYSKEAVKALAGEKIVNGYSDGSFLPKNSCTRAEAAKIVYSVIMKGE